MRKICFILTLLCPLAATAEVVYTPAKFASNTEQLAKSAQSVMTENISVLYCQSEIATTGKALRTHCYDKEGNSHLVSATESVMATLNFSSAEVDGEKVPVRMSYRVAYNRIGDTAKDFKVTLIPNLGSMQERYGRDYVAPQERLDVSDWYEAYSKASWVNGNAFLGEGNQSRVAATVDARGKTDVVRLVDAERAYERDAKIVKNALRKSRFIPGFINGKPVPMGYLAVVHYDEQGSALVKSK